ncbi:REDY-like protein HapK [Niveispirillum sp. SYP-B3756]|uniref:REDY-like protein HapK n=1 Tax=Niveispirillum sp. SYP-B3756 TaxID=2662178 RepID=UPI001292710F|nr:REDY-like protein HapK [Niveispirillum sp. SYP-B3756]MQP65041.1 REDY-like protein HapK [Niveispirillum sp. SYP-B3756]
MSSRIVALFNLKPGVSVEQYEAWAKEKDLPVVNGLKSIDSFEVFRVTGSLTGGAAPYQYVEIIDIADMAAFGQDIATEKMQAIAAEFQTLADVVFLTTDKLG